MVKFAWSGCRTSVFRGARGKGIEVFREDDGTGEWQHVQHSEPRHDNPSWLTRDPLRQRLYALHGDGDKVSVYLCDEQTGRLTLLAEQTTGPRHSHPALDPLRGNNPVHAAMTPDGHALLIANHEAGNIALLPVNQAGTLDAPTHFAQIAGHQSTEGEPDTLSRPHEIVFAPDSDLLAVPIQGRNAGNGIDMIRVYRYKPGELHQTDEVHLPEGSWPRHVDFHPNGRWLYCLSELSNTLTLFHLDRASGTLHLSQRVSSLPDNVTQRSDASEIEVHPSGRFVYAANRGHDTIALFTVNPENGWLTCSGWIPCGGRTPRFTTLSADGAFFYCANEESDNIVIFSVDAETGWLTETGRQIITPSPTCLCLSS